MKKLESILSEISEKFNLSISNEIFIDDQKIFYISKLESLGIAIHSDSISMYNNLQNLPHIPHLKLFTGTSVLLKKTLLYFFLNSHIHDYILFSDNYAFIFYKKKREKKVYKKRGINDKRISQKIDKTMLKQTLLYHKEGYISLEKNDDSSIILNRKKVNIQGHGYNNNENINKSFFEYLERLASLNHFKGAIRGTYEGLQKHHNLVHPKKLGLYTNEVSSDLIRYNDNLEVYWVRAASLKSKSNSLIPEQYVQYLQESHHNQFVYDNSNGCALGNTLEEATLYGLFEVIEREMFLNFWFLKKNIEVQELEGNSNLIRSQIAYFDNEGYDLKYFLIRNSLEIPVVLLVIFSKTNLHPLKCLIGTGSHFNVIHAIESAFNELCYAFNMFKSVKDLEMKVEECFRKGVLLNMQDHVLYFASKKGSAIVKERLASQEKLIIEQIIKKNTFQSLDIKEELQFLTDKVLSIYPDVYVVDQTNTYLKYFNLNACKVIIEGAIPLDFGSDNVRITENPLSKKILESKNLHPLG